VRWGGVWWGRGGSIAITANSAVLPCGVSVQVARASAEHRQQQERKHRHRVNSANGRFDPEAAQATNKTQSGFSGAAWAGLREFSSGSREQSARCDEQDGNEIGRCPRLCATSMRAFCPRMARETGNTPSINIAKKTHISQGKTFFAIFTLGIIPQFCPLGQNGCKKIARDEDVLATT
jgi:hypothetical protein